MQMVSSTWISNLRTSCHALSPMSQCAALSFSSQCSDLRLMPALATKAQFLQGDGNKETAQTLFATPFNLDPSCVQWWILYGVALFQHFAEKTLHNLEVVPPHNAGGLLQQYLQREACMHYLTCPSFLTFSISKFQDKHKAPPLKSFSVVSWKCW